jgi:hypothetical protein
VQLRDEILGLEPGTVIRLKIDGHTGFFVKMENGTKGASTNGIKPVAETKAWWRRFYSERRGDLVEIAKA